MAPPTLPIVARADAAVSAGDPNVTIDPTLGVKDPHDLNQVGFFILFGLIGAALVVLGVWFFFRAKNGGFEFQDNDWDDYKSTVLRRRGPNGTILSNATKSTNLGGGSVYKDYDYSYRGAGEMMERHHDEDARTVVTESTNLSGITAGASDIAGREKRKRKQERRDRERERRRRERGEDGKESSSASATRARGATAIVIDEDAEKAAQEQLRMYRSEKAARVGGMNKSSDASVWDGSTNPTMSVASSSSSASASASSGPEPNALLADDEEAERKKNKEREQRREKRRSRDASKHRSSSSKRERSSTSGDKDKDKDRESRKSGGIRKVYSTADKRDTREQERIRAEARRADEKGRAAKRATRTITEEDERAASGYGDGPSTALVDTHGDLGVSSSGGGGHKRQFSWSKNETDRMLPAPGGHDDEDDEEEEEEERKRRAARSEVGGASQVSALSDESGTKSYHHPMPELGAFRQGGYSRGRGEDYDE